MFDKLKSTTQQRRSNFIEKLNKIAKFYLENPSLEPPDYLFLQLNEKYFSQVQSVFNKSDASLEISDALIKREIRLEDNIFINVRYYRKSAESSNFVKPLTAFEKDMLKGNSVESPTEAPEGSQEAGKAL